MIRKGLGRLIHDLPDGIDQLAGDTAFGDILRRPGFQEHFFNLLILMNRQSDDFDSRMLVCKNFGRFDAIDSWHVDIHHHHIGKNQFGRLQGFFPIFGFSQDNGMDSPFKDGIECAKLDD